MRRSMIKSCILSSPTTALRPTPKPYSNSACESPSKNFQSTGIGPHTAECIAKFWSTGTPVGNGSPAAIGAVGRRSVRNRMRMWKSSRATAGGPLRGARRHCSHRFRFVLGRARGYVRSGVKRARERRGFCGIWRGRGSRVRVCFRPRK